MCIHTHSHTLTEAAVMVEPGSEIVTEGDTLQRMVCLQLGNSSIPVAVSSTVDSSSTADSMSNS